MCLLPGMPNRLLILHNADRSGFQWLQRERLLRRLIQRLKPGFDPDPLCVVGHHVWPVQCVHRVLGRYLDSNRHISITVRNARTRRLGGHNDGQRELPAVGGMDNAPV